VLTSENALRASDTAAVIFLSGPVWSEQVLGSADEGMRAGGTQNVYGRKALPDRSRALLATWKRHNVGGNYIGPRNSSCSEDDPTDMSDRRIAGVGRRRLGVPPL
jgi:hypothetical protein